MPQSPDLNKYLDAGVEFVAMTRAQARTRAKDLVAQGHLAQNQVQAFVDDLVDESRRRSELVLDVVRQEIQRQVKVLGIATKDDLSRLESKIGGRSSTTTKKSTAKKSTGKKPAAKKSTAGKKAAAKKSGAKKSAGAKSVAPRRAAARAS